MHYPVFLIIRSARLFRVHCTTEGFYFCCHVGNRVEVRTASQGVTPPLGCPPGRLFVPECLRSEVIRWGHCSKVACHPGVNRTSFLVKTKRFWWPSMACDIVFLFWLTRSVLFLSLPIDPLLDSFSRCQFLRDPGPTFR